MERSDDSDDGGAVEPEPDPLTVDSDGDTYLDGWEIAEGTDPTDPESRIYVGYWPYNPDKDRYGQPDAPLAQVGLPVPRLVLEDQHGDRVDLYDFADDGRPMVIDLSGLWCGWCHEIASFVERAPSVFDADPQGMECLPDAVEDGEIFWVTVIYAGYDSASAATASDRDQWYAAHPSPHIPVLLDADLAAFGWFQANSFPSMVRVDTQTMTLTSGSITPYKDMLPALCQDLAERE